MIDSQGFLEISAAGPADTGISTALVVQMFLLGGDGGVVVVSVVDVFDLLSAAVPSLDVTVSGTVGAAHDVVLAISLARILPQILPFLFSILNIVAFLKHNDLLLFLVPLLYFFFFLFLSSPFSPSPFRILLLY